MRVALKYSAGLIALYLVVYYASGSGQVIDSSTRGIPRVVGAFQGRTVA